MSFTSDICENESTDPWVLACKTGNIRELDILKDNYHKIHINALCSACKCGHLDVLEWFDRILALNDANGCTSWKMARRLRHIEYLIG